MTDFNATGMKRAALINDLSCMGKCSLSVALPIVSAFGVEGVALPTAVLSTHTADGFGKYAVRDMTEDMKAFIAHWKRLNIKFDCIYTGFFNSVEQLDIAENFIRDFDGNDCMVIVDPVLGDNGAFYGCFDDAHRDAMRRLCALADVITPNRTEASLLTGIDMNEGTDKILDALNVPNVIITGVRRESEIGYAARFGDERTEFFRPWLDTILHGTGDVFTSALCGELMNGRDMRQSFESAAEFCDECIKETAARQPSHWYGLAFEEILRRRLFGNEQCYNGKRSVPVVR